MPEIKSNIDGIILIDKEKGYTSNDVVQKVKRLLNTKVGHTGTLDPNATGVLPLLLGDATKVSKYLINHDKEYEATLQLGKKTATGDEEGSIIEEKFVEKNIFIKQNIENVLSLFIGKQEQTPPIYSAIKINGKKLYQYARDGQNIEIKPRQIEIYDIKLRKIDSDKKQLVFDVKCSKGTYIRALCEDIATKLGNVGYMKELNRIKVGEFSIENAITISELESYIKNNDFSKIITIEEIFNKSSKVQIQENDFNRFMNGVKVPIDNISDGICKVYMSSKFIGIGIIEESKLKRDLIII